MTRIGPAHLGQSRGGLASLGRSWVVESMRFYDAWQLRKMLFIYMRATLTALNHRNLTLGRE